MFNKKFLLGVTLSMALCLSSCYNDDEDNTETTTTTGVTTAAVTTTVSETTTVEETTTKYDTGNPEEGLVFFIQPIIEQYDEYDKWNLADWECSDTELMYHYGDEWRYRKELIFVFSNYTDEPVTIDSIQIVRESDGTLVNFADGSDALEIDFTVQPMHRTDYLLKAEDFDYSACESGIYNAVVNVGLEGYGREFFIDNEKTYTETSKSILYGSEDCFEVPAFLNEEQRETFSKAYRTMSDWFWCEHNLAEGYANSHTVEEFIDMLSEGLTYDYAMELSLGTYIDKNGEFIIINGSRGMDMSYYGHCFLPVSADENQVSFKAVVIYAHSDNPYKIWFEEKDYHMVNTKDGWRVFQFDLWN
ncbi:MAG: hypothetical protein K2H23_09175 [Oscillospiraceae bacterium]|nr:hypothetical protein [Oscillospiraceae bacterium]